MIDKFLKTLGLKTIDLYIIKKFLGTFFFAISLILAIVVVFDLAEKIEDFIEHDVSLYEIVFVYYINFIPYFANLFSSLFIFISVIFFTSKLTSNSEIVAILSSGISYQRLMLPYFYSALILAIISFLLTSYVIPNANKDRIDFELKYIDGAKGYSKRNVHKQILPGVYAYLESYDNYRNRGYKFALEKFEDSKLSSKLIANRIDWDSTTQKWKLSTYYIRNYSNDSTKKDEIIEGNQLDTTLNMHPKDFRRRLKSIETLNADELDIFIEEQTMKGDDNLEAYKVEKYRRLAFPFSTFILTLIGVSLSTKKKRGGIGINIAVGIALSFIYILFMQVFSELAKANSMPAMVAVWIPNILFLAVGVFLYIIAPK